MSALETATLPMMLTELRLPTIKRLWSGLRSSTVAPKKRPFLRFRPSVHAGCRPISQKVLWWHVCNKASNI